MARERGRRRRAVRRRRAAAPVRRPTLRRPHDQAARSPRRRRFRGSSRTARAGRTGRRHRGARAPAAALRRAMRRRAPCPRARAAPSASPLRAARRAERRALLGLVGRAKRTAPLKRASGTIRQPPEATRAAPFAPMRTADGQPHAAQASRRRSVPPEATRRGERRSRPMRAQRRPKRTAALARLRPVGELRRRRAIGSPPREQRASTADGRRSPHRSKLRGPKVGCVPPTALNRPKRKSAASPPAPRERPTAGRGLLVRRAPTPPSKGAWRLSPATGAGRARRASRRRFARRPSGRPRTAFVDPEVAVRPPGLRRTVRSVA